MKAVGALLLLLCSCGSRSTLNVSADGASAPDAGGESGATDASVGDAPTDVVVPADVVVPVDCFGAGDTLLAPNEGAPTAIAVDATHVYWATAGSGCADGEIRKMPKGGGPIETLAGFQPNPRALALDQDRVYFFDACGSSKLASVSKTGGVVTDYFVNVSDSGRALALSGQYIYYSDYGVMRVAKSGGPQYAVNNKDYVYALAGDSSGAYWIGLIGGGPGYAVFAHYPDQASATLLAQPSAIGNAIAVDKDNIYFSSSPGILRLPKQGGPSTPVATGSSWRIAVDESHVYWTDGYAGGGGYTVNKAPKGGGGDPTVLATGSGAYVSLAVDDRCVYFADLYGGEIRRAPK